MVTDNRPERKLCVILHADVVDSTRLVRRDETVAHQRITDAFSRLSQTIELYGGKVREIRGDALVAEFARASDAVFASLAGQADNAARNASIESALRPTLRIGIALGEVVIADNTITGPGVVLAQRLEQIATAGGVCVQGSVYEAVPTRLPFAYNSLGEQDVKGFDDPVRAYTVELKVGEHVPAPSKPRFLERWTRRGLLVPLAAALVLGAALGIWILALDTQVEPDLASVQRMRFPLPDKPSIAVLPFTNLSDDPSQNYFADGLTEDLITDLSKISGLFVVSRNSTFAYKGTPITIARVAEELGVRYVLEGSVRRVANQVRINAQLIDATNEGHLWAERYDGSLDDIFNLQDSVTQKIVDALAVGLTREEADRDARSRNVDPLAHDLFLRGLAHYRRNTPDDYAKAIPFLEKALELEPDYSRVHALLASVYWESRSRGQESASVYWQTALGLSQREALSRAQKHLATAQRNPVPLAHQVASGMLTFQGLHAESIREAERAIELDANDPSGYEALAAALILNGQPQEAESFLQKALRLDPLNRYEYLFWLGAAQFGLEKYAEAVASLSEATQGNPEDDRGLIFLISAFGYLGRNTEAAAALDLLEQLRTSRERLILASGLDVGLDVVLPGPYTLRDVDHWAFAEIEDRERLRQGLRMAGVPKTASADKESPTVVAGATTVSAGQAKELFDLGATFIDVRGSLYEHGHVPGAVHLIFVEKHCGAKPCTLFNEANLNASANRNSNVVIYCQGPKCLLSSKACRLAVRWGFERVYYFRDGFPAWKATGYPVALPDV